MAKRILNRREMRADFDAAEARTKEEEETEEDEEGKDDEEEDEDEEEGEGAEDDEAGDEAEPDDEDLGDDEDAPPKKKKKVAKAAKVKVAKPRARSRTAKIVRMRVVWGVFDNSNKCVATYEYPRPQGRRGARRPSDDRPGQDTFHPAHQGADRGEEGRERRQEEIVSLLSTACGFALDALNRNSAR